MPDKNDSLCVALDGVYYRQTGFLSSSVPVSNGYVQKACERWMMMAWNGRQVLLHICKFHPSIHCAASRADKITFPSTHNIQESDDHFWDNMQINSQNPHSPCVKNLLVIQFASQISDNVAERIGNLICCGCVKSDKNWIKE